MSAEQRATSLELIESILREPIRRAVLGLVEDGPDDVRQTYGTHFYRPTTLAYTSVIERLTTDESEAVRLVALFHAQEIGLSPRSQPAGRAA